MAASVPWAARYARAQVKAHGWNSVPSWLALAVQMHYNEGGCAANAHVATVTKITQRATESE